MRDGDGVLAARLRRLLGCTSAAMCATLSEKRLVTEIRAMSVVVRVSVLRCDPPSFERFRAMMEAAEPTLRPGIEALAGLLAYYAGADEATNSLTNTSVWQSLENAKQMDSFQPMLDLAKQFAAEGARFDRPIMNYTTLWQFGKLSAG